MEFETFDDELVPIAPKKLAPVTENDISALVPAMVVAQNLRDAHEGTAPSMLSDLSAGLIRTSTLLASARYYADKATAERKRVAGVLALEDFVKYCAETGTKSTEGAREAFINSHPRMLEATDHEAYTAAMVTQIDIIRSTLMMGISSVKAIVYGYKDSSSVTGNRV